MSRLPPGWPGQLAGCVGLALLDGAPWLWLAHVLTGGEALLTGLCGVLLATVGHIISTTSWSPCFLPAAT